ncbi:FecR family protein [Sphingomonas sp. ASY06-1R]|jgi:transmembrane sensor|uniref:FecR family protein n=1 Tax=Sphingomonas sp. ASY06-1R TaxID=3445771 RepID=UPI003FA3074D
MSADDSLMAARWVARMDSGVWTEDDETALRRWLAADPRRHGTLLRSHATWLAADRALDIDRPADEAVAPPLIGWGRRSVVAGLAAAGVAALVGSLSRLRTNGATKYATEVGEIRRVPLSDGSVMTMNSGSELAVRMHGKARSVALAQGEAWFDVAKDAERPFVVAARKVKAQAIGTAFSVRMRDDAVEILVNEGVVEAWSDDAAFRRIRLEAGQRALVGDDAAIKLEPEQASSVDRALAWRSGMIDLDGKTLQQAADEFNRYNDRKIVIADPTIGAAQIDGVFRINDPEGFAISVRNILGASVNTETAEVIRIQS